MRFVYGKQELCTRQRAEDVSVLLTNGLGGYLSTTAAFSAPRCDQGLLAAAVQAPNRRVMLVHRLKEVLRIGQKETFLSTQSFAEEAAEDGWKNLSSFTYQYTPCWRYHVGGVMVERKLALGWEENTAAALYTVENRSGRPCTLEIVPQLKFAPKEDALKKPDKTFRFENGKVTSGGETMHVFTDAALAARPVQWEKLHYTADEKDGRPAFGYAASCFSITRTVEAGETAQFEVVFFTGETAASGTELLRQQEMRLAALEKKAGFADPAASQLAAAADAFIARRASTNGKTILAGYPLFSDWGRDTMIALPGCCLETGRYEDAKSILRTFLAYEKDGLVPNLFPEGAQKPMYNTVDAALLLMEGVWLYIQRSGDRAFLHEAYPVMERIIAAYRKGTHHGIRMDADGLITAGEGLDQVTWMDVCVNGILPTPRHGKPVEVNAYWYNALAIMAAFAKQLGKEADYEQLAEKVKRSFAEKFYMPEKGYLKDVLSGTDADEQIRCNQIWAVSMSFSALSPEQEKNVVETVYRQLYTPCGLRTLSPEDPQYHGSYGGEQLARDLAYHQGTVWVFPLGAYYRAYLKVHNNTPEAAAQVRRELDAVLPMLREGCIGQLPEIYSGDFPAESKGCFAQAWSVGEMLRVYAALEKIEGAGGKHGTSGT